MVVRDVLIVIIIFMTEVLFFHLSRQRKQLNYSYKGGDVRRKMHFIKRFLDEAETLNVYRTSKMVAVTVQKKYAAGASAADDTMADASATAAAVAAAIVLASTADIVVASEFVAGTDAASVTTCTTGQAGYSLCSFMLFIHISGCYRIISVFLFFIRVLSLPSRLLLLCSTAVHAVDKTLAYNSRHLLKDSFRHEWLHQS